MLTVKIARVPGTVSEVTLEDGTDVATALQVAGMELTSGILLQVNGREANVGDILTDGARVTLAKGAKGNSGLTIKVARVPGTVQELVMEEGATVGQALSLAGMEATAGILLQRNGSNCTVETRLENCDRITLAKGAKGNS